MNRVCILILAFAFGFIERSYSQTPSIKPIMPPNDSIHLTIDLNTGNPTIFWTVPPYDPLSPAPIGYIIFKEFNISNPGPSNCIGFCEYDTTYNLTNLSYTDLNGNANQNRLSYQVASLAPLDRSQKTRTHSNTFVTAKFDSCNHILNLEWQQYEGWGNRIDSNFVYFGTSPNWTNLTKRHTLAGTINHDTISNIRENTDYYLYIVSRKDTAQIGGVPYVTRSNLLHKNTLMPIKPSYMSIDSILAEDKKINLYFKIDPSTELTSFQIVRWEQSDSIKSLFSTKILHKFSDPTLNYYADTVDSWAARTRPFYYKVDAINSCPLVVKVTNHTNSITPVVQNKGLVNIIQWDSLKIDKDLINNKFNTVTYKVTRYAFEGSGNQLPPVTFAETSDLQISDDVSGFEGQGYSIKFCYQVEADEKNTSGNTVMVSRSRIDCTEIVPGVSMPDAIIPNDNFTNNGKSRNIFVPTITFQANYTLSIYNRLGSVIFEGYNVGWDGKEKNGRYAKPGSYIYRLTVHTLGNRQVNKTGTVTVVYK